MHNTLESTPLSAVEIVYTTQGRMCIIIVCAKVSRYLNDLALASLRVLDRPRFVLRPFQEKVLKRILSDQSRQYPLFVPNLQSRIQLRPWKYVSDAMKPIPKKNIKATKSAFCWFNESRIYLTTQTYSSKIGGDRVEFSWLEFW